MRMRLGLALVLAVYTYFAMTAAYAEQFEAVVVAVADGNTIKVLHERHIHTARSR